MKKILSVLLFVFMGLNYALAQCNPYYDLKESSKWELTSYNHKDKITGRQVNEIKSLEKSGDGWKAVVHFKSYDKKDKLQLEKDVEMECKDGVIHVDMERFVPEESLQAFKDMDMTLEVDNLEWPADLAVGQALPDAAINISSNVMNMSIEITDRKVESKESITTPAGTFETLKVPYTIKTKMMMNMEGQGIDYLAKDIGVIRSETYNKNGKMTAYTLLTSYE